MLVLLILCTGTAGAYWFVEERLTDDPSLSQTSLNNARSVAFDAAGNINVVWTDYRDGYTGVYHKSFDGSAWSSDTMITLPTAVAHNPSVAADAIGNIHAVWTDYRHGNSEIYYRAYDGSAWGTPERISSNSSNSFNPSVAAGDSGEVYVVWQDFRNYNWDIYYKSFDGAAWSSEQRLTDDASNSMSASIAVGGDGAVHVAWQDYRDGNDEIYYKRFDETWGPDERLTTDGGSSEHPSIAVDADGDAHVVWEDDRDAAWEIYHKVCQSGVWDTDERITYETAASSGASIATDSSGGVHIVWNDERHGNEQIYYKRYDGLGWGVDVRLSEDDDTSQYPSIAVDPDGNRAVVWQDNRDGNTEIYARRYDGGPFPPPVITSIVPSQSQVGLILAITDLAGQGFHPGAEAWLQMSGEPDVVATDVVVESSERITCLLDLTDAAEGMWDVVVENPDGQRDTLVAGFEAVPNFWGDDVRLTVDGEESSLSLPNARCVAIDSFGHIHVVWSDKRDGNREIYYKKFDGISWGADQRLTYADYGSMNPAIALDGNDNLHIVWDDHRDDDYEIYYKKFDGVSWGADKRLTVATGDSRNPSVAAYGDNRVTVVWQDKRPAAGQYLYLREHDGSAWQPEIPHSASGAGVTTPAVCLDTDNNIHIVWWRNYGDDQQVCHLKYDRIVWSDVTVLANAYGAEGPTVAAGMADQIHVAWQRGDYEIYYRRFNGLDWDPADRVADNSEISGNPSLVMDPYGIVHLVWSDRRDGNREIYYSRHNGVLWGQMTRLTNAAAESKYPSIATGPNGALHVIWRDYRDDNFEIYYKRRAPDTNSGLEDKLAGSDPLTRLRVAPNPLKTSTHIEFSLIGKTEPRISIYDTAGRLVRKIETGPMSTGPQRIFWDGTSDSGRRVAPGIYFLEVSTPDYTAFSKVIVLR